MSESGREPDRVVIAVDGPSGSGKSTVARGVARALGLRYLDTGAMYRAVTWAALQQGVDPADAAAIGDLATTVRLEMGTDPSAPSVSVDGADASVAVRTEAVTAAVSAVSAVPAVRTAMVRRQRELIGSGGIVVEGRDIGTTVLPDADLKIFLTASAEARAARRSGELKGADVNATREALIKRDAADSSRKTSPLAKAGDAVEVDTTALTLPQVIECVVTLVEEKRAGK